MDVCVCVFHTQSPAPHGIACVIFASGTPVGLVPAPAPAILALPEISLPHSRRPLPATPHSERDAAALREEVERLARNNQDLSVSARSLRGVVQGAASSAPSFAETAPRRAE